MTRKSELTVDDDALRRPKLLYIDDDPDVSKAMKIRLERYGIDVIRAFNGMQGFWTGIDVHHLLKEDYCWEYMKALIGDALDLWSGEQLPQREAGPSSSDSPVLPSYPAQNDAPRSVAKSIVAKADSGKADTSDPKPTVGRTILVIDDDEDFAKAMEIKLKHVGARVLSSISGLRGVEMARQHIPDLILCDFILNDAMGSTVISRLQDYEVTQHIPIIVVSGYTCGGDDLEADLLSMGAVAFFTKPLEFDALLGEMEKHLALLPAHATP